MAFELKIKYFNSFWLKKVVGNGNCQGDTAQANWATTGINYASAGSAADATCVPLPTWPGIPWNPEDDTTGSTIAYPTFPWGGAFLNAYENAEYGRDRQWFVEEARIRGGYNNTTVDFGVKAFITEENDVQEHRISSLIYSGPFNSRTGINDTNVFSIAEDITKSLNPSYGSIQKLFAENTNLTIFQENKVTQALIDKDAIYSAEGTPIQTSSNVVIGQVKPYLGEYGISLNPESFATYGFAKYFADQNRGVICRLSRDGITEISSYGMLDFFRDELATLPDNLVTQSLEFNLSQPTPATGTINLQVYNPTCDCENISIGSTVSVVVGGVATLLPGFVIYVNKLGSGACTVSLSAVVVDSYPVNTNVLFQRQVKSKIVGGWDIHQKYYTLSLQYKDPFIECEPNDRYNTLTFDEQNNGWVSFVGYKPTLAFSVKDKFYSINNKDLYEHYNQAAASSNRNVFYGQPPQPSYITFVFNPKVSVMKNFNTVSYEGSNGWEIISFIGSSQEFDFDTTTSWTSYSDIIQRIPSYVEGEYIDPTDNVTYRSGFDRKENRYVANLINSSNPMEGEVVWGEDMSGIKGYYSTVTIQTDNTTNVGGLKELWAVSSNYVMSSF